MTALLALSPLPPANELMENYHSFMGGVMIGNEKKKTTITTYRRSLLTKMKILLNKVNLEFKN